MKNVKTTIIINEKNNKWMIRFTLKYIYEITNKLQLSFFSDSFYEKM